MTARCDRLWYRLPAPNTPSRARVTYYWLAAIASHPFAYATHRLLHFNAETMFMVPPAPQCIAAPQLHDCFGRTGAGRRIGSELPLSISDYLLKNPLVWPIFWLTIAVSAVALPKRENNPIDLASEVLLGSALLYGGAYLIVGIAMNVRYFYWVYVATQTALLMLLYERRPVWVKRHSVLLIAPLAIVVAVGYGFRIARIETFLN